MATTVWRSFKFFDSQPLNGPIEHVEMTCCTLSPGFFIAGDCTGGITFLDRSGSATVIQFQAYTGMVTHVKYVRSRHLLATLGDDDDTVNVAVVRLWDIDRCLALYRERQRQSGVAGQLWRPPCREHRLFTPKHPAPTESVLLPVNLNAEVLTTLRFHVKAPLAAEAAGATSSASPPHSNRGVGGGGNTEEGEGASTLASTLRTVVISFDVAEDLLCAAVGLANSECVVLHGDLEKERTVPTCRIRSRFAKGKLTFVGLPAKSRVGVGLRPRGKAAATAATAGEAQTKTASSSTARGATTSLSASPLLYNALGGPRIAPEGRHSSQVLFTVFEDTVTAWTIAFGTAEYTEFACPLKFGAAHGAARLTEDDHLLVASAASPYVAVLRPPVTATAFANGASGEEADRRYDPTSLDAVQLVEVEGQVKRCVLGHRGYVVLLCQSPQKPSAFTLQCYDVTYHLRALARSQEQHVNCAFLLSDAASVVLVCLQDDGRTAGTSSAAYKVTRFEEVDTYTKLDLLFQKECYGIAKSVAASMQQADPDLQVSIQKRYGDYLYERGKFAEAMEQYKGTIGHVEPSYVIRKYVEGPHIALLTSYLEELHHRRHGQLANVSHTTLLLHCYIKEKQEDKLMQFAQRDDIRFDPDTAITVCREGLYFRAALCLADKYAKGEAYVQIQLSDLHQPLQALAYLRRLGVDEAEAVTKAVGKELLRQEPRRTTELLIELCVQWQGPARRLPTDFSSPLRLPPRRADPADYLPVFVDSPVCLLHFLRAVIASGVLDEKEEEDGAAATTTSPEDDGVNGNTSARDRALYHTLLEMYLTEDLAQSIQLNDAQSGETVAQQSFSSSSEELPIEPLSHRREQALVFLDAYRGRYDDYVALSLVFQHRFDDGICFLLRRLNLSTELLNYYGETLANPTATEDERHMAKQRLLEMAGRSEGGPGGGETTSAGRHSDAKVLWMAVLAQLIRSPSTEPQDITRALDHIEAHDLLTPVTVMGILRNAPSSLQLRTVRSYCERALRRQTEELQRAQQATAACLEKLRPLQEECTQLQTSAVVFTATQCAHCNQPLDLPTVHFLCRHSFHQRCLHVPTECNLCAPDQRRQLEALREQYETKSGRTAASASAFVERLRGGGGVGDSEKKQRSSADAGFDVLHSYVANGVFRTAPPVVKGSAASAKSGEGKRRSKGEGEVAYGDDGEALHPEDVELW